MKRTEEKLKALKALNTNPRDIQSTDVVEFVCHTEGCGNTGLKRMDKAIACVKTSGWAFQCDQCRFEKSAAARAVHYSEEFLIALGAVDTTPRTIKARDLVELRCKCGSVGEMIWYDAIRNEKRNGHVYQCRGCYSDKMFLKRRKQDL